MINRTIATILAAAAVTVLAAPVLADTSVCTIKSPEIRLRKSPSKNAHIVAILKKDTRVTAESCAGGWVKVASEDGRFSGYVGGWALSAAAPKVVAAAAIPAVPEVAKAEPVLVTAAAPKDAPTNEKLAIQITELRLNVLGIERDMEKMNHEIQKIKVSMRHKTGAKKVAAHKRKGLKQLAKR